MGSQPCSLPPFPTRTRLGARASRVAWVVCSQDGPRAQTLSLSSLACQPTRHLCENIGKVPSRLGSPALPAHLLWAPPPQHVPLFPLCTDMAEPLPQTMSEAWALPGFCPQDARSPSCWDPEQVPTDSAKTQRLPMGPTAQRLPAPCPPHRGHLIPQSTRLRLPFSSRSFLGPQVLFGE